MEATRTSSLKVRMELPSTTPAPLEPVLLLLWVVQFKRAENRGTIERSRTKIREPWSPIRVHPFTQKSLKNELGEGFSPPPNMSKNTHF